MNQPYLPWMNGPCLNDDCLCANKCLLRVPRTKLVKSKIKINCLTYLDEKIREVYRKNGVALWCGNRGINDPREEDTKLPMKLLKDRYKELIKIIEKNCKYHNLRTSSSAHKNKA